MDNQKFLTLHRHWIWCEIIKKNFDNEIKKLVDGKLSQDAKLLMPGSYGAYMSIWCGLLFSVLETLKNKDVVIRDVESDINDIYEPLNLYRNAVFHPQPKYWPHKLFEIMKDKDSADKIWRVHSALGKYFLEEINKKKSIENS